MLTDEQIVEACNAIWRLAYETGRTPEQVLWEWERLAKERIERCETERSSTATT